MSAERYKYDPTRGELERLRAEVRDLKARLRALRRDRLATHANERLTYEQLDAVLDTRVKNWRKP